MLEMDGRCPSEDYLRCVAADKPKDFAQLVQRIERIAGRMAETNPEIFKPVGGKVFEIKSTKGSRLYCFQDDGRMIIIAMGADKPKRKQQQRDIKEARDWRRRYFERKTIDPDIPIVQ